MELFRSEGKEHAWVAAHQALRLLLPRSESASQFQGKEDAWEIETRNVNALRQVKLLA